MWILLPFAALAALGAWFFTGCTDGWCPGALQEALIVCGAMLATVLAAYALLRRRGLKAASAAGGAWLLAITGLILLYTWSQFGEGDIVSGTIALVAAAATAFAFYLLTLANPFVWRR